MAEKLYLASLLSPSYTWRISQSNQTQFDTSTQNYAKSHNYCEAVDFASNYSSSTDNNTGAPIKAPVDMVVKYRQSSSNGLVLESKNAVQFANGVVDKFCILLFHENSRSLSPTNYPIGSTVTKNTTIYREGVLFGSTSKPGNRHVHIHCGRGTYVEVKIGGSNGTELFTSRKEICITELFLNNLSGMASTRRLKWLSSSSTTNAYLVATKGAITIRSSICGTSLFTVSKGNKLNIRLFEARDYTGYASANTDNWEWARASFTSGGVTYAGFIQLDTAYYTLEGGVSANVKYSPYYTGVYLRTGLPYKDSGGNIVRVETGKVWFAANTSTKLTVSEFIPGLQADGYSYAKISYNSKIYYAQIDTVKCYVLSGGFSYSL